MKKDIEKKNKFIHFLEKWIIIGIILFLIIQIGGSFVLEKIYPDYYQSTKEDYGSEDYIGHWYCGTFFITMNVSDNFLFHEKYDEMNKLYKEDKLSEICFICGGAFIFTSIIFLIIATSREHKKKLLEDNTPLIVILSGVSLLFFRIFEELDLLIETKYYSKYSMGFLSTVRYYPQIHYIFIIPGLLIALGLVFRQMKKKKEKETTEWNEILIKAFVSLIFIIGGSFILIRFSLRLYELIMVNNITIKLPFYYFIFDLPREFAISSTSYTKLVVLRFIKDLPVFISSVISIYFFSKILLSSIKGQIVSEENNKRYKIIFISLLIASLIFNLLGIYEVHIFNNEFTHQYQTATYTIALRSLTEPLLYGFFIYLFKHYTELVSSYK